MSSKFSFYSTLIAIPFAFGAVACTHSTAQNKPQPPEKTIERQATLPIQADDSYYKAAALNLAQKSDGEDYGRAKNIILFIGDGMGISTMTAIRIHAGQSEGKDGESYQLNMDSLPHTALSKTYSHNAQVSDSAATATAMLTGVKSPARTLGVTQAAVYDDCASIEMAKARTLFELAETEGLATGLVSTARLTHATPAAAYAHAPNRNWEDDGELSQAAREGGCTDIASQFLNWPAGDHFEIALAGGRRHFTPVSTETDTESRYAGRRQDNRDIAAEWAAKSENHVSVFDKTQLDALDLSAGTNILGLFQDSHMSYELDRTNTEPSISEMTRIAIERLSQNEKGYLLMVEAGRIDHGHHGTNAARALGDGIAFDEAIGAALEMTDREDTLIIVTADHSHTFVIQGYPGRNNPILGKVIYPNGEMAKAEDGKPYTTLAYTNGSSAEESHQEGERQDLSDIDTTHEDYKQQALIPLRSETHAGEDVAVLASGPGAHLVRGVIEQNEIFHIMGHASGLIVPYSEGEP